MFIILAEILAATCLRTGLLYFTDCQPCIPNSWKTECCISDYWKANCEPMNLGVPGVPLEPHANVKGPNLVEVSWLQPAETRPVYGYKIYYGSDPNKRNVEIDSLTRITSIPLDLSTPKYITIRAYNIWGWGPESSVIIAGGQVPDAPTNFTVSLP